MAEPLADRRRRVRAGRLRGHTSGHALENARPALRPLVVTQARGSVPALLTVVLVAVVVLVQTVLTGDSGARAV